jgi:hypothetical protein
LAAQEVDQLRALRPAHLRVDLVPGAAGSADTLRRATAEAQALGTELEVALLLPDDPGTDPRTPELLTRYERLSTPMVYDVLCSA